MTNSTVLDQIVDNREQVVFKGMRSDMESGKALLNPEQLGQFLREAALPNTILAEADFKLMQSFKKELTRVGINGRVLESGYKSNGETQDALTKADVKFGANVLDAKKLKAMCEITDDEKEDNITQQQFEQTLLSMMGERIGEDLEYWALFADTSINLETNKLLSTTDGWLKLAENKIKSAEVDDSGDGQFDLKDGVEAMFDAMIYKLPPRFRQQRNNLKFYVPFEVEDAYRNVLASRGTPVGDTTQTTYPGLNYKGIPIAHCVTLDDTAGQALDNTATSILVNPKNLAYGIWKNVSIEPKRLPEHETTQYYYRIRGDVDYYFRNAAVTAKITTTEAKSIPAASKA